MSSLFLSVVDDDDDRDVERKRRPSYVGGKKEVAAIALIIALLAGIFYVVFVRPGIARAQWVRSQENVKSIYGALMLYAGDNSDGLPTIYLRGEVDRDGLPITWASHLLDYTRQDVFKSPAASDDWDTLLGHYDPRTRQRIIVSLSYGMLADAATRRTYELRDDLRIIVESVGGGQAGTLNPLPLGERDGFMIGYNDSNLRPTPETEFVTRVAFIRRGGETVPLHAGGVVGVRADGALLILAHPEEMRVGQRGNLPFGPWVVY